MPAALQIPIEISDRNIKRASESKADYAGGCVVGGVGVGWGVGGAHGRMSAMGQLHQQPERAGRAPPQGTQGLVRWPLPSAPCSPPTHDADVVYEAYGIGGTGFVIECLTDNLNRSAAEVKSAITKGGGKVGTACAAAVVWHQGEGWGLPALLPWCGTMHGAGIGREQGDHGTFLPPASPSQPPPTHTYPHPTPSSPPTPFLTPHPPGRRPGQRAV